jgi:hypothetical protein
MTAKHLLQGIQGVEVVLTINNQLCFGADLANTIVSFTNICSLVTRQYIFYYQTLIAIQNFGSENK